MLAAAIAAGVTGVFGTPVGGVLFSIETTSTVFLTATYGKCVLAAIVCRCAFDVLAALSGEARQKPGCVSALASDRLKAGHAAPAGHATQADDAT
jgi:hypothetical protein